MMPLEFIESLSMSPADILDILLVAAIIYVAFRWIKGTSAMNIFIAIVSLFILKVVVSALRMKMMMALLSMVLDLGLIALVIIFQPEIRRFLNSLGGRYKFIGRLEAFFAKGVRKPHSDTITEIVEACREMSAGKEGALIVLLRDSQLEDIVQTGDRIDARVNRRLLRSLFFKNSPLHDGAVIIGADRIVAARCTLPITDRADLPPSYGMRHKAAVGITQVSDAVVVVVSEETGRISLAQNGEVTPVAGKNELRLLLDKVAQTVGEENGKA